MNYCDRKPKQKLKKGAKNTEYGIILYYWNKRQENTAGNTIPICRVKLQ